MDGRGGNLFFLSRSILAGNIGGVPRKPRVASAVGGGRSSWVEERSQKGQKDASYGSACSGNLEGASFGEV